MIAEKRWMLPALILLIGHRLSLRFQASKYFRHFALRRTEPLYECA